MNYSLIILLSLIFIGSTLMAQTNIDAIDNGVRIYADTKLRPTTKITPTSVTTNRPVTSFPDCGTTDPDTTELKNLPWYGNPQYLEDLLDSVEHSDPCPTCRVEEDVRYRIPLQFWVYNNDAGNAFGVPNDEQIRNEIDAVNEDHRRNRTGIRFYLRCDGIARVNSSTLQDVLKYFTSTQQSFFLSVKGAINVHVVRSGGSFYNALSDAIFVNREEIVPPPGIAIRSTLSHEIGHALGLAHTHLNWGIPFPFRQRFREPVDRNRTTFRLFQGGNVRTCSVTGDLLCDTPADPRLVNPIPADGVVGNFNLPPGCNFFGNQEDIYGDQYANPPAGSRPPDPNNLMTYGDNCRQDFTREQIAVMIHRLERGKYRRYRNGYTTFRTTTDFFEPDDAFALARDINLNTPELRTFNQSYRRDGTRNRFDSCDEDWVVFNQLRALFASRPAMPMSLALLMLIPN